MAMIFRLTVQELQDNLACKEGIECFKQFLVSQNIDCEIYETPCWNAKEFMSFVKGIDNIHYINWLINNKLMHLPDLQSANLSSANLQSADLRSANLQSANLSSANLRSADLQSANLSSADLQSANLSSANLHLANLQSANLRSADLQSADLRSADLHSIDLENIFWNECTIWPAKFDVSILPAMQS